MGRTFFRNAFSKRCSSFYMYPDNQMLTDNRDQHLKCPWVEETAKTTVLYGFASRETMLIEEKRRNFKPVLNLSSVFPPLATSLPLFQYKKIINKENLLSLFPCLDFICFATTYKIHPFLIFRKKKKERWKRIKIQVDKPSFFIMPYLLFSPIVHSFFFLPY